MNFKKRYYPYWFFIPALAIYGVVYVLPTLLSFFYGFTDWNIALDKISFQGFENYRIMWSDPIAATAFRNSFVVAFLNTVLLNVIGLGLAVAINRKFMTRDFLKSVFFVPCIICPVILGFLFTYILHPTSGILNGFLHSIGLSALALDWLGSYDLALYSIVAVNAWAGSGYCMVIYLSGLQSVPGDLVEAARIDGANAWQIFSKIKFPLILPAFNINLLITLIVGFKLFDIVLVLTGGGPGTSTQVISTFIRKSFSAGQYGYGSALNVVLFLLISAIALPLLGCLRKKEVEI